MTTQDFEPGTIPGSWKPKTNSKSSHAELLEDYKKYGRSHEAGARLDKRNDPAIFWKPVPYDPRFPNIDITQYCWQSYIDFFRCQKMRGTDYEPCQYYKHIYSNLCPSPWVEAWDEQRENNCFIGLPPDRD